MVVAGWMKLMTRGRLIRDCRLVPVGLMIAGGLALMIGAGCAPIESGSMESLWREGAAKQPPQPNLQTLLKKAREKKLWEHRVWRLLIHYRQDTLGGGVTSEVDGASFFLAQSGRTNPQAELEATLSAFFTDTPLPPGDMTAQCAYPARLHWLAGQLGADKDLLPRQPCERLEEWRQKVDPESVSLIFSSYYANNPSTMFGHTLLRFNKRGRGESERLLDYAVNFAAAVNDKDNGMTFALRGILGGYAGYFSDMPYYLKVREYNDLESRDLWEYKLHFTPAQMARMLRHTWEMGRAEFEYYFFDENCSYQLLTLMEVANPDLRLTGDYWWVTIPTETVRSVASQPGFVSEVTYRPARSTEFYQKLGVMTITEKTWVFRLMEEAGSERHAEFLALPPTRRALMMDAATDALQFHTAGEKGTYPLRRKRLRQLLLQRSRLREVDAYPDFEPGSRQPQTAHKPSWIGVYTGRSKMEGEQNSEARRFSEINLKPTFHDLLSSDEGLAPDSQVNFMNLRARYEHEQGKWSLEEFTMLDLVSLFPGSALGRQPSWKLASGWDRPRDVTCDGCVPFYMRAGIGLSLGSSVIHREVYFAFLEGDYGYGRVYQDWNRAGLGLGLGALLHLNDWWRVGIFGSRIRFALKDGGWVGKAALRQSINFTKNMELRLDWSGTGNYREVMVGLVLNY